MEVLQLRSGLPYPRSTGEFPSWLATDADCLDYLDWLRWPTGFVCPRCGHAGGRWARKCVAWRCSDVGDSRDPLRSQADAADRMVHGLLDVRRAKDGICAQRLQRSLEIGSYPTGWAMLHRLRSVLVRPGRDRLTGTVEVDQTYIGGEEPGLRGGPAQGKKALVGVAVEVTEPGG